MNNMEIKNGKRPLSSKPVQKAVSLDDIFGNTLAVDKDIASALKAKGMNYRWISYPKYLEMGNSHERGWRPVKRSECRGKMDSSLEGADVDGFIRRGDLVLAVRSSELGDKHKAYLKQEASRASGSLQKKHAEELRKFADAEGIKIKVTEGYGEEE